MARTSAANKVAAATAAPTTTTTSSSALARTTLVIDNGAHTIKAGFSSPATEPHPEQDCKTIPNCISRSSRDKKTYIGSQLYDCIDYGELAFRRPIEKGFVVNWEGEKAIWSKSFLEDEADLKCDPHETNLILTEAPNAPIALQRNTDEMVFEEFEFASYYRVTGPLLNAYAPSPFESANSIPAGTPLDSALVIDAGHSYTTITPLLQGRPLHSACRRLEIGGKTLTNQLKELVSRTFDIRKEDWIATEIKEDVCYVSQSFNEDLEKTWKGGMYDRRPIDPSVVVDYILPDYEDIKRGYYRPHDPTINLRSRIVGTGSGPKEHILTIGNERFVVPELLFTPSDIGMQQDGVCGLIKQSLDELPLGLQQLFLANIVIVGGCSKLPGFVERLEADLRSVTDTKYLVRIGRPADPIKNSWLGGARLAQDEEILKELVVTRQDYLEHGDLWTRRKMAGRVQP